jgi:hypothetical protein
LWNDTRNLCSPCGWMPVAVLTFVCRGCVQDRAKAAAEAAAAPEPVPEAPKVEVQKQRVSSSGEEPPVQPSGLVPRSKHKVNVKSLVLPAVPVKSKSSKESLTRKAQQFWNKNMGLIIFVLVMLLVIIMGMMMV